MKFTHWRGLAVALATAMATAGTVATIQPAVAEEPLQPLVTPDTPWNYLDTGVDPATDEPDAWAAPGFDDSSWKTAAGTFGAKKGKLADLGGGFTPTVLLDQYEENPEDPNDPDNKPAFFFRTTVEISEPDLDRAHTAAAVLHYDDAVSFFVNGTYVGGADDTDLQPYDDRNYYFAGSGESEPLEATIAIPKNLLKEGTNVFGARINNVSKGSSDIYFDAESITLLEPPATSSFSNIVLGSGATESQRTLVWYSPFADETVQLAKASDLENDGSMPSSATSITPETGDSNAVGLSYHHAVMENLEAGTDYAYRMGGDDKGWSDIQTFSTDAPGDFTFLFIADPQLGSSNSLESDVQGWQKTLTLATETHPDANLLISGGDQVEHASAEDEYLGLTTPGEMTSLAFAATVGNHDYPSRSTYDQHYELPNYDSETQNHWYVYNGVLFMHVNTNVRDINKHKAWLEQAIAAAGDVDFKVMVNHHSIYSTASHEDDQSIIERRAEFPPVLTELGIDLVLAGHDHVYARTHVMKDGAPVTSGRPDTVTPKAGEFMYLTGNSSSGSKFYSIHGTAEDFDYIAHTEQNEIPNYTSLKVSECAVDIETVNSGEGSVVDKFTMLRTRRDPVISGVDDVTLSPADVDDFDAMAGVAVTDPCESGLVGEVTGEVSETPGDYPLTYSVTDAYGNEVTKERTVTVQDAPQPTVTVTATVTAQPTSTPTVTVTAQPTSTPTVTATVTAQPTSTPTVTVTAEPTSTPTVTVTAQPTSTPTVTVTAEPTSTPTVTATATSTVTVTPTATPVDGTTLYTTPGFHRVNGRDWHTTCEPYSRTTRCRTEIWSTQITRTGDTYVQKTGWHFNNLTYLPEMTRAAWGTNPLANAGSFVSDGRKWRTECDTAATGGNGCRSFLWAPVISATKTAGQTTYTTRNGWVFNNIVRFK